jgi:hypothetical protein
VLKLEVAVLLQKYFLSISIRGTKDGHVLSQTIGQKLLRVLKEMNKLKKEGRIHG